MKYFLLLLSLQLAVMHAYTQGINQEDLFPTNIIQASPNAASLGEYGQYPVGKFTGIPNINIPLYTIQDGDIEVPISISYHAGGYKPGEDASLVGHGWSLNAGGTITRSVNGHPDENEFFKNMAQLKTWEDAGYLWTKAYRLPNDDCGEGDHFSSTIPCIPEAVSEARYVFLLRNPDTQADLFFYNFPGGVGKFQFNEFQDIIKFPYSDTRISFDMTVSNARNGGIIKSFNIETENGLEYGFNTFEETSIYNQSLGGAIITDPYVSAWHLNRIQSKIGNRIVRFDYSSISGMNRYPLESESVSSYYSLLYQSSNSIWNNTATRVHLQEKLLKRVTWSKGYAEFVHSERNDIHGGEKLDKILIFNNQDQLIRSYRFSHSYFSGSGNLRLDSLHEVNPSGKSNEPYVFDYNGSTPANDTKGIDHYGFYNGAPNTRTIPYRYNYWRVKTVYADREIKPDYHMVGMLRSIVYPTKGKTEFEYENNESHGTIYERRNDIVVSENCDENGGLYLDESGNMVQGLACQPNAEIEFTIPDPISTDGGFTIEIIARTTLGTQIVQGDIFILLKEKNVNNNSIAVVKRFDILNNRLNTFDNIADEFQIEPGKTYILNTVTNIEGTSVSANFFYYEGLTKNYLAPGIRIKEVKNYDYNNSIPIQSTKYYYGTDGNNDVSSGIFHHKTPKYHYEYDHEPEIGYFNVSESSPRNTKGQFAPPTVYYKQVEERGLGNGGKRFYYSFLQNLEVVSQTSPDNRVPTSEFWKVGQLNKKLIFNENDESLKRIENYYSYIKLDSNRSFVHQKWFESGDHNRHLIKWAFNYQVSGIERLDSTIITSYANQESLVSREKFYYAPDTVLLLPIARESIDAQGSIKRIETEYLNDRDAHVITPVLNKKSFNKNMLVNELDQYLTGFKPTSKILKNGAGKIINEVDIQYQNGLDILRISDKTGIPKSYTWAYDQTLPIIEKTGSIISIVSINSSNVLPANYQTLDALLEAMDDIVNDPIAQNNWKQFNINLRSNYGGQIKTYTYKPLVGMTSSTDENGIITYYDYDGFGRLVRIKDYNNDIIKTINYSFKK